MIMIISARFCVRFVVVSIFPSVFFHRSSLFVCQFAKGKPVRAYGPGSSYPQLLQDTHSTRYCISFLCIFCTSLTPSSLTFYVFCMNCFYPRGGSSFHVRMERSQRSAAKQGGLSPWSRLIQHSDSFGWKKKHPFVTEWRTSNL